MWSFGDFVKPSMPHWGDLGRWLIAAPGAAAMTVQIAPRMGSPNRRRVIGPRYRRRKSLALRTVQPFEKLGRVFDHR